ncbi:MAG TPA: succinyl-diaminopimelate desuccinylase [Bauldia sp.]|nr:succinyl-diaminopimelate desuccinylase [Bauldia sp.]
MNPARGAPNGAAAYLQALVRCPSVTPAEGGALAFLEGVLKGAGFNVTRMTFNAPGTPDVENLFATIGRGPPHLAFAGHTDVVPPGDEKRWSHGPFSGDIADGFLYGRGAVDMKGGIAAFLAAALAHRAGKGGGTLSFLITGDEEGPSINGTARLLDWALHQGHRFDAALVGEPTSQRAVGDTIKIGRRGSLSGTIRVTGKQGHVAYPQLADNPVPKLVAMLDRIARADLDKGTDHFQPSNLEIVSVDVGNPAFNVIPAEARARFNIRFNDAWTRPKLEEWLLAELGAAARGARFELQIEPGASDWFLTRPGPLVDTLSAAVEAETRSRPELSTGGGTSDARFFKDVCPVVEFGLVGDTMHQVDERVRLADLDRLTVIYRGFLNRFFADA